MRHAITAPLPLSNPPPTRLSPRAGGGERAPRRANGRGELPRALNNTTPSRAAPLKVICFPPRGDGVRDARSTREAGTRRQVCARRRGPRCERTPTRWVPGITLRTGCPPCGRRDGEPAVSAVRRPGLSEDGRAARGQDPGRLPLFLTTSCNLIWLRRCPQPTHRLL
jgi:hypothetical protein